MLLGMAVSPRLDFFGQAKRNQRRRTMASACERCTCRVAYGPRFFDVAASKNAERGEVRTCHTSSPHPVRRRSVCRGVALTTSFPLHPRGIGRRRSAQNDDPSRRLLRRDLNQRAGGIASSHWARMSESLREPRPCAFAFRIVSAMSLTRSFARIGASSSNAVGPHEPDRSSSDMPASLPWRLPSDSGNIAHAHYTPRFRRQIFCGIISHNFVI